LAFLKGPLPNEEDVYDITQSDSACKYGHCNIDDAEENWVTLGWDGTKSGKIDIRLFYAATTESQRGPDDWTVCRFDPNDADLPKIYRISQITERPICYTTEALKYAQSGYLVSIVCV
jgi:hypothetical protein